MTTYLSGLMAHINLADKIAFWCLVALAILLCPRAYRWYLIRREARARITYGGKARKADPFPWAPVVVSVGIAVAFVVFRCNGVRP